MMTCVHLKKLYDLCMEEDLKIGSADLVRIVCNKCGEQDVCPSVLMEEYEAQHPDDIASDNGQDATDSTSPQEPTE